MATQEQRKTSTGAARAVLSAVAQAADGAAPGDGKREAAYARALPAGDCRCVERTAAKLRALDQVVHVWVRDARAFRHGRASDVPFFSLRVDVSSPVRVLRSLVEQRVAQLSTYRPAQDGALQLCLDDRMLDDDRVLAAYLPRASPWPKPFAGVLWLLPWRPSRPQRVLWGGQDAGPAKTRAQASQPDAPAPETPSHENAQ